jgi:hypothetical protein
VSDFVLEEFLFLWDLVTATELHDGVTDTFLWRWSSSGQYTASSTYQAFFLGRTGLQGARELWKCNAPERCKFFVWLILYGRCWTADRLKRHGLADDDSCSFCAQQTEHLDHLLLTCPYSKEVWFRILNRVGLAHLFSSASSSWVSWWLQSRKRVLKHRRKGFDTLVLLTTWSLWKERNARYHDSTARSCTILIDAIWDEGRMWLWAGYKHLGACAPFLVLEDSSLL